jgi:hypothetical protein
MTTETQTKPRPPAKPKPKTVPPAAYELHDTGLPFNRQTFYRWESLGLIKLLRIGSKTLLSAETRDAILDGSIQLPKNAGMTKPPKPQDRGGWTKKGRRKPKPEADQPDQPAAPGE